MAYYESEKPPSPERAHMRRAIDQARLSNAEHGKITPKVGAVLVQHGRIVAEAYRGELKAGEHAEYTLLERKLPNVSVEGATLYTTLEPCTIRRDPKVPCANRIIERGIGKVYIGVLDPNELIRGNGWWMLREADIEVAMFDSDLLPEIDHLNRDFTLHHRPIGKRSAADMREPLPEGQIGRNGGRIGYMPNGDKVEWLPDDENAGEELPLLLRRNDKDIVAMYEELWEKVWYNRQQVRRERIAAGDIKLTPMDKKLLKDNEPIMRDIEERYGKANLRWDDFDWGLLSGRMSALAWVMGSDWEGSLDT